MCEAVLKIVVGKPIGSSNLSCPARNYNVLIQKKEKENEMDTKKVLLIMAIVFVLSFFIIAAIYGVSHPDEAVCLLCGME